VGNMVGDDCGGLEVEECCEWEVGRYCWDGCGTVVSRRKIMGWVEGGRVVSIDDGGRLTGGWGFWV